MSGSLNRVQLIGNVGQDPEVRSTQAGKKIVTFSLATSESWIDERSGERCERTEWHRIVVFNEGLAGVAEKFLNKGAKIFLEGQIRTRKWQDQSGADRYTTEIHLTPFNGNFTFLDSKRSESRSSGDGRATPEPATAGSDPNDEAPF